MRFWNWKPLLGLRPATRAYHNELASAYDRNFRMSDAAKERPIAEQLRARKRRPTNRSFVFPANPADKRSRDAGSTGAGFSFGRICSAGTIPWPSQHRIELIGSQTADVIDCAGGPVNLDAIDLGRRAKTEVHAQIVLRKIAAAAVDFAGLRHAAGDNLHARIQGQAIALGSGKLKAHPVAPRNALIPARPSDGRRDRRSRRPCCRR